MRKTIVELRFEGHDLDLGREWPLLACCLKMLNEDVVTILECLYIRLRSCLSSEVESCYSVQLTVL